MTDKPSDVLARAADILMERGWIQGRGYDEEGRVCLVGAISVAGHFHAVLSCTPYIHVVTGRHPIVFNDAPATTFDMVIGALHDAQIAAKEAGQ